MNYHLCYPTHFFQFLTESIHVMLLVLIACFLHIFKETVVLLLKSRTVPIIPNICFFFLLGAFIVTFNQSSYGNCRTAHHMNKVEHMWKLCICSNIKIVKIVDSDFLVVEPISSRYCGKALFSCVLYPFVIFTFG